MEVDTRRQQLRATFQVELEERVQELTELLLRLERDQEGEEARQGIFAALFRGAHSLKGAARAVDLRQVEELTHELESALAEARQAGSQPEGSWFDAIYRMVDALSVTYRATMGEQIGQTMDTLQDTLPQGSAESPSPKSAPAPVVEEPLQGALPVPAVREPVQPRGDRTAAQQANPADSVRVAVIKLDALLEQAGELAVTRGRITECLRELRGLSQDMMQWRREWQGSRVLRSSLHRRSTAPVKSPAAGTAVLAETEIAGLLQFADLAEQRLHTFQQRVATLVARLHDDNLALGLVSRAIEDEVMAVRLLPLSTIFAPLERLVRDLARDAGKEVQLALGGGEAEIDRKILDRLRDPLMHMLRNAVDHGIEPPTDRVARGKPRGGTITLSAVARGNAIEIALADDGVGIDTAALRATAVSKGLLAEEQAAALTNAEALDLIFRPGFSTREKVSETSGRGVGMDVVRENVKQLGGHVALQSTPGQGTRFVLSVPLTLATTRVILLEIAGQIFALSSLAVERAARVQMAQLVKIEGNKAVPMEGVPIPMVELADILERRRGESQVARVGNEPVWRPFVVLRQGDRRIALLVDQLIGEQEIVVKSLGWPLQAIRNVAGAAVLGSGRTVVILNASDLLRTGLKVIAGRRTYGATASLESKAAPRKPRLLVVEDSLTTRALEMSILEAAGYTVVAAANGMEALQLLRSQDIDLVVSDVEMPLLDGFALTTEVRRDEKLRQIPVILVTSLETQEYRERGAAAGADAYVLKSQFHQGLLLDTVGRLL